MAAELLQFDPTSENAANSPLTINDASYKVTAYSWPAPQLDVLYASSVDTEGELPASRRYRNRPINLTIRMTDPTGNLLSALQAKVTKIAREGGTLKRTMKNGDVIVFDLLAADEFVPKFDVLYHAKDYIEIDIQFAAKPFGRGTEVTLSAHNETTLPCLVFTETGITGDVPALGRLTITEAEGQDQALVIWGEQSMNYDSSADAALFYEAEGRTPLTSAALAAGPSGASGAGGNKVISHTSLVADSYLAVLSTQAAGGGNHLRHVGDFNVWARVQINTMGSALAVKVALEWAQGDFRTPTRNAVKQIQGQAGGATWLLVDLGQVHLTKVVAGTQRWEGRVIAKGATDGDDLHVDYLMLVPVAEGSGRVSSSGDLAAPSAFTAFSAFLTESGPIAGDALALGGTWAGAGDIDDFSASGGSAIRTAVSDAVGGWSTGRFSTASGSSGTKQAVRATMQASAVGVNCLQGVLFRYVDTSNFGLAWWWATGTAAIDVHVGYTVAGVSSNFIVAGVAGKSIIGTPTTLTVSVDVNGRAIVLVSQNNSVVLSGTGSSSHFATGGALASGKAGIFDNWPAATASTRTYDNFGVWTPELDAAVFASQSLEIRHDRTVREDSGGTLWVTPSSYEGDYLLVPPAGAEGRTNRFFVKGSRGEPGYSADSGIDDISATLSFTPRYLVVP